MIKSFQDGGPVSRPAFALPKRAAVLNFCYGRFTTPAIPAHSDAGGAGSRFFVRDVDSLSARRQKGETNANQRHCLRMRDVADRRGDSAAVGEILFGSDVVHPVRYRSCISLSVGGDLQVDAERESGADFWVDDLVFGNSFCRLHLRGEKRGV
jgi:hypothetical protein